MKSIFLFEYGGKRMANFENKKETLDVKYNVRSIHGRLVSILVEKNGKRVDDWTVYRGIPKPTMTR